MTPFVRSVAAQAAAETRMRLRSPATLVAVLLLGAASFFWIPDPAGRATSLAWRMKDGRDLAPEYSSGYLAWASAIVACLWASLVGFYLVAGSIRRDRARGVGAILAATPLPDGAYLVGKAAAHLLYLGVLSLLAVGAAWAAFLRWGVGPFRPLDFAGTWILFTLPALVLTASAAVLFDVAPVLRGRAGLVIWFFVFAILVSGVNTRDGRGRVVRAPRVDPIGMATLDFRVTKSMPGAVSVSSGLIFHDKPFTRVPWNGVKEDAAATVWRLVSLVAAVLPLGVARIFFDRFDPAARRRRRGRGKAAEAAARVGPDAEPAAAVSFAEPVALDPSALRSVVADARLTWDATSWAKWPLLAVALAAPFAPESAFPVAAAALFLLLGVAVAEVAAREDLAGTRGLVFAQPGVPVSSALWKAGSILLFTLAAGLPCAVRAWASSAALGSAFAGGLLFTAGAAAGFGSLTGGGKLFLGVYTALWYFAVNRLPIADFTGLFAPPSGARTALYVAAGAAAVALAAARERVRR